MNHTPSSVTRGVVYVSVWVLLWGTAASIVDAVLLGRGAYEAGTTGQALTFASYAIASLVLAVRLSPRFLKGNDPDNGESSDPGS